MKALPLLLLVAAIATAGWYLNGPRSASLPYPGEAKTAAPELPPAVAPVPAAKAGLPASSPAAVAVAAAVVSPSAVTTGLDAKQKAELARQVAQSQSLAVAKYPKLAEVGSEINVRFVFRYKGLVAEHSPRLQDPRWPVQLADECAEASGTKVQPPSVPSQPRVASLSASSTPKPTGHH